MLEAFRSEHSSRNRPVKVAYDVVSHCYHGKNLEAPLGWRPFSTLDRDSDLPPSSKPGKEPEETAGFGRAVQLGKGKETWDFPSHVPRYPFWCRQLFGYAPRDPGSYQTWTQVVPWATAKRRAKSGASVSLIADQVPQDRGCRGFFSEGLRAPQTDHPPPYVLSSRVGVVARGWGERLPEAGPEHN